MTAISPDGIITPDKQEAKQALDHLDAALADWAGSTLRLALAIADAQATRCWEQSDDFMHQLETGALEPVYQRQGTSGPVWIDYLATYLRFRGAAIGDSMARKYGAAGRAYRILEAEGTNGAPMPENERQLRPMTKALQARLPSGKLVPEEDLAANLAECWEEALKHADNNPSKAAAIFPQVARKSGYKPLAHRYTPIPKKLREAIEAERFDRDLAKLESEFLRLCGLSTPFGIRKLAARFADLAANEEAHRG